MKNIIKITAIAVMIMMAVGLFAQNPPHPNGGNAPGASSTPVGGGAPIDGGLSILLLLGAAYGSGKILKIKKLKTN
jgi:hypothetical protein